MKQPIPVDPELALHLREQLLVEPPQALRQKVLGRHRRRQLARRAMPALALCMVGALVFIALPDAPRPLVTTDWQQRSAQLEAAWREAGDPAWLRDDARAQRLLRQLRQVDHALGQSYALNAVDPGRREQLWRERSETLSALIDSRRQGGIAVQL